MQATAALLRVAGFSGAVYLFDELQTVSTLLWSIRQRFLSYEFLNMLIDVRKHAHCFFGFATTPHFGMKLAFDRSQREYYSDEYPEACRSTEKSHDESIDLVRLRRVNGMAVLRLCKASMVIMRTGKANPEGAIRVTPRVPAS